MGMDRSAVYTVPSIPTHAIELENPSKFPSAASNGLFPFTQSEDSEFSMYRSEPDTIYISYMEISAELQLQQAMEFCHSLDQIPWNLNLPHLNTDCSNMQGEMWSSLSKALLKLFCSQLCKLS